MTPRLSKRRLPGLAALLLAIATFPSCTSVLTSISAEPDGRYAVTGTQHGPFGFVWIGDYDPATKTFTVLEMKK